MSTIADYFEQAQLSMAAYVRELQDGAIGSQNGGYVDALVNAGMSKTKSEKFAETYEVIDQYTDTISITGVSISY